MDIRDIVGGYFIQDYNLNGVAIVPSGQHGMRPLRTFRVGIPMNIDVLNANISNIEINPISLPIIVSVDTLNGNGSGSNRDSILLKTNVNGGSINQNGYNPNVNVRLDSQYVSYQQNQGRTPAAQPAQQYPTNGYAQPQNGYNQGGYTQNTVVQSPYAPQAGYGNQGVQTPYTPIRQGYEINTNGGYQSFNSGFAGNAQNGMVMPNGMPNNSNKGGL